MQPCSWPWCCAGLLPMAAMAEEEHTESYTITFDADGWDTSSENSIGNVDFTAGATVKAIWKPAETAKVTFTDVAAASPFAPAISWAVEKGITKGKTDTTFAPDMPCTRGQIVTLLYRAYEK